MAFDNSNDELDPIALLVLLMLSGGQRFTFRELVRELDHPNNSVLDGLNTLLAKGLARPEGQKFMIDNKGVEYLIRRGILASDAEDEPQNKNFKNNVKPPMFPSWVELWYWLAFPAILFIFAAWLTAWVTADFNFVSVIRRLYQVAIWVVYFAIFLFYVKLSFHSVPENERLVIFRGGKAIGKRGPGRFLCLPLIDHCRVVDMREKSQEIKKEPCITRDNMLVSAGFYITWKIDDPIPGLTKVSNVEDSMSLLATAALRTAIAEMNLEESLEKRRALNTLIRARIEHKAGDWGVEVKSTELRELQPPDNVLKQIENRFNAALESEAALTKSDAKIESLRKLFAVGSQIDDRTFNLKYLDTLEKVGEGSSTKYVIPMEFFNLLKDWIHLQENKGGNHHKNGNNTAGELPPGGPVQ